MTEITATYVYLCQNLCQYCLSLSETYITEIRKERFLAGKPKLVREAPPRRYTGFEFLISLGLANSNFFLSGFI